jgi:hypothetical protein
MLLTLGNTGKVLLQFFIRETPVLPESERHQTLAS